MNKAQRLACLIGAAMGAAALLGACATSKRPPKTVVREAARPGPDFPRSEDYYPSASQRLGESGRVVVRACVGIDGKLQAEPAIARGSGSPRLDEGALRLARAGSGHYEPATENRKPVASCFDFSVTFAIIQGPAPATGPLLQGFPAPRP